MLVKNNAFFNTLDLDLEETFDIYLGIVKSFNKENLYKLYLAQVNSMCFANNFITFEEYIEKSKTKEKSNKTNSEIYEESLNTLRKLQERGE